MFIVMVVKRGISCSGGRMLEKDNGWEWVLSRYRRIREGEVWIWVR